MQNLITANNANTTLDESTIGLGSGTSNNFTTKVPSSSESSEKFNKIFENTTRRQNDTTTPTSNDSKEIKKQASGVEVSEQNAAAVSNTDAVKSKENSAVTVSQMQENTQDSQTAPVIEDEITTDLEIPQTAAVLDNIIQVSNYILNMPEIQAESELAEKINNLLNEVKIPEILTTQNLEQIQEDFKVIADEAESIIVQSQSDEVSNPELPELNNTKEVVIKTTDAKEEPKPVQNQNIILPTENEDPLQEAPVQIKRQAKNETHTQQTQPKGPTIEVPEEAIVNTELDTLSVSENDIVDENGETVKIEQPRSKEWAPHAKTIDTKIVEELDVNVEQVVVASQAQTQTQTQDTKNNSSKNPLNASEHVIKLSIEDIAPKSDKSTQDAGSNDLLNNGKQDFNPEAFKLNLNNTAQSNVNNTQPVTFDEAMKNDVLNQIGAKFEQLQQNGGTGKITLALRPLDLGRVVIEITQNANGVTTNIIAHNSSIKELLEKNIEGLKQQLVQAGVNVQNINVKTADNGENSEQKEHTERNKEEKQEQNNKNQEQKNKKNNKEE